MPVGCHAIRHEAGNRACRADIKNPPPLQNGPGGLQAGLQGRDRVRRFAAPPRADAGLVHQLIATLLGAPLRSATRCLDVSHASSASRVARPSLSAGIAVLGRQPHPDQARQGTEDDPQLGLRIQPAYLPAQFSASSAANPLESRSICFLTVRKDQNTQRPVAFHPVIITIESS